MGHRPQGTHTAFEVLVRDLIEYDARALITTLVLLTGLGATPPNHDEFLASEHRVELPRAAARSRGRVGAEASRFGVPSFYWADRGRAADFGVGPELAARRHLAEEASLYRIASVDRLIVDGIHDTGEGAIIVSFGARVDGVPVFREALHVVMNQALELVAISGALPPEATRASASMTGRELSPRAALAMASLDLAGALFDPADFTGARPAGGWTWYDGPAVEGPYGRVFPERLRVREVVYAMPVGLFAAYHVELAVQRDAGPTSAIYAYVIDATEGRVLFRKDLTEDAAFAYRVYADANLPHHFYEGPQGDAWMPHPTGRYEPFVTQVAATNLITLDHGPISTQDPWLEGDATETNGNNVDAYADLDSPDGLSGSDFRATITSTGAFDYAHDPAAPPASSQRAAIVQLFYLNNYLHDWFYDRGFDELARNAQTSNYGRGGMEDDNIRAEVQDYSGTNNANMSTRADGARPRMQMYVWLARPNATVEITAPSALAQVSVAGNSRFTVPPSFAVTGALVVVDDGDGDTADGCQPYVNSSTVAGNIALVARGGCNYLEKALNAEAAGAAGVLLTDDRFGWVPPDVNNSNDTTPVPIVSVTELQGDRIRAAIANGETVTVTIRQVERPDKDSGLDGAIVSHEWGHYLSNRLIANAAGLSANQSRGMGEGWSDFVGLLMTTSEEDAQVPSNANWSGTFGVGVNSSYKHPYYGIRRVPYSVDVTKNALTFGMIADGVALPSQVPTYFGLDGATNSAVHRTGEVWSTMLWECYVALLRDPRHTFDQARDRMARYLVAGLKMTPPNPTFVEARNGVLAAAYANDPDDFTIMYEAFARRGAGLGARAPDRASPDNHPVVESFVVGNAVELWDVRLDDEAAFCDRDGVLDAGEVGRLRVSARNVGVSGLTNALATVTSADPRVSFPSGNAVTLPSFLPFDIATVELDVALTGSTDVHESPFDVVIEDPTLVPTSTLGGSVAFRVNWDVAASASATDDVEAPSSVWSATLDATLETSQRCERIEIAPSSHRWLCPNVGAPADVYLTSPPIVVSASGGLQIAFDHRYDIEPEWDGAVLEISDDDGMTWVDVGAMASPAYDGALRSGTPNPLEGRDAWNGTNPSYPAMDRVVVDLGTAYQGQTIRVRFRLGSDTRTSGEGWEIDDIEFVGIDGAPFPVLVADDGVCINRAPVADAGPDFAVDEGTDAVQLDASASTDADGDTLRFVWSQILGPVVMVSTTGSFDAPLVEADTTVAFRVTVLDDDAADTATVTVTILDSNRPVELSAGDDQRVDSGEEVRLRGTAFDPDGDPFTVSWAQTEGPEVTLTGGDTIIPAFIAPPTDDGLLYLTFEVTAVEREYTSTDEVTIAVGAPNQPPTIVLGDDQEVEAGATVTLTAMAEDPDGDAVTVTWSQVSGPTVALYDRDPAGARFDAPFDAATIVVQAEVSDGELTAVAMTTIVVKAPPFAPDDEGSSGCGCSTGARGSRAAWWLLGLLVLRRRRSSRSA